MRSMRFFLINLKSEKVLLILVILAGSILRLSYTDKQIFGVDQTLTMTTLEKMSQSLTSGNFSSLPLEFPATTSRFLNLDKSAKLYNGAFLYYLIFPMALITSFNPARLVLAFALISITSIYLGFTVGKELFNVETGLMTSLFMATSGWMVEYSKAIWYPTLIVFFVLLAFLALAKIIKKYSWYYWLLLSFSLGTITQLHISGYLFLIFILFIIIYFKIIPPMGIFRRLVILVAFLIPLIPTIIREISSGFILCKSFFKIFISQTVNGSLGTIINNLIQIPMWFLFYIKSLYGYTTIFNNSSSSLWTGTAFIFIITTLLLLKNYSSFFTRDSHVILLIGFIFFFMAPWFVTKYYDGGLLNSRFSDVSFAAIIIMAPIFYLWISYFVSVSFENFRTRIFIIPFLFITVFLNTYNIKERIWDNRQGRFNFADSIYITSEISKDTGNQPFELIYADDEPGGFFVYLFGLERSIAPERLNHTDFVENPGFKLNGGLAANIYTIVRSYNASAVDNSSNQEIMQKGSFKLFKNYER